jgi:hypothetical protein
MRLITEFLLQSRNTAPATSILLESKVVTLSLSPEARARRSSKYRTQTFPPATTSQEIARELTKQRNIAWNEQKRLGAISYRGEARTWLASTYPGLFTDPPRPLEIGITKRILAAAPAEIVPAGIKRVMSDWCTTTAYLQVRDRGDPRVTLEDIAAPLP